MQLRITLVWLCLSLFTTMIDLVLKVNSDSKTGIMISGLPPGPCKTGYARLIDPEVDEKDSNLCLCGHLGMASPLLILYMCSILIGFLATVIIVIAVSVDNWELTEFDGYKLRSLNDSCSSGSTVRCEIQQLSKDPPLYRHIEYHNDAGNSDPTNTTSYLYSMHSGLWRICDLLNDNLRDTYIRYSESNFGGRQCFTFVTDYDEESDLLTHGAKQIARLQNSAASCYIVVIIDLSSAAVVGIIGIVKKQVASCMVTGVLYLMAALFGVFGLSMFHTKDYYEKYHCNALDSIPDAACSSRDVQMGFAVPMAWVGVVTCAFACMIWLGVSRALRVIMAKTML